MEDEKKDSGEKEEEIKEKDSDKKQTLVDKIKENPWKTSTVVLGVILLVFLFSNFSGLTGSTVTGSVVGEKVAGDTLVNLAKTQIGDIEIINVEKESGLYKVSYSSSQGDGEVYLTLDGKNLVNGLIPVDYLLSAGEEETSSTTSSTQDIPKSDKPIVELFVMSYCPYGTQAEKGILPVVELLGDKIDFRMRYVSYLMHGEKEAEENLREYCIQEIAPEKYLDYMYCFLEGDGIVDETYGLIMNGNDVDSCLNEAGIDTSALEICMAEADEEFSITENLNSGGTYPKFNIDAELNEKYGISGSPGLVVNGVEIAPSNEGYYEFNDEKIPYSRSPETYKQIICSLFTDAPEECSETLSSSTPSAYFGWDSTGVSTTAQC